ncbi:expressed unknown protein [Seminavis robusta]|uniref:Pseudouridine synthase RsuA/RluA-like domain-containing protein n=1 Tax=Seminavis robusta TaxID=568900 RepID=A0A9N8DCI7_9STRA|nr:expressed unknown protein [Seminavis robusta]|eukprot:Sro57_g033290.1 n/a (700) ;mRNA; r:64687-66870
MGDQKHAASHQVKPRHHHKNHNHNHHPKKNNHKKTPSRHNSKNSHNSGPTKEDLWKGAEVKTLNEGWIVEMTGLDSKMHTVYARAVQTADCKHPSPCVQQVVDAVVDVAWKHIAKHILEQHDPDEMKRVDLDHRDQGAFPPASQLLKLGAVWLVNETSFLQHTDSKKHHHTKKKRLTHESDGERTPDWKDYVLRVHYAPSRYHAMEEVDWSKYCRGLLMGDQSVQVFLGDRLLPAYEHVPTAGYPDQKDGVIVYEDAEHGFAVINKPGTVPDHATVNNHAEDVLTVFAQVLHDREKETRSEPKGTDHSHDPLYKHLHHRSAHLNLPLPLDTETQGLVIISTKRPFNSYMTNLVEHPPLSAKGVIKKYKCLICVKTPEDMATLNNLQESRAIVKHFYHHNPNHKHHANFVSEIPSHQHRHEYGACHFRLLKIGTNHGLYAANVSPDATVGDTRLAQRLWGLGGVQNQSKTLNLGVTYVAQLEVEQVVDPEQLHTHLNKASRLTPQQLICGQLSALGFPLVGDGVHGGGTCEVWGHRHGWNRLALQCCEWSFPQPQWPHKEEEETPAANNAEEAKEAPATEAKETEEKEATTTTAEEKKEEAKEDDGWKTVEKKPHGHHVGRSRTPSPSQDSQSSRDKKRNHGHHHERTPSPSQDSQSSKDKPGTAAKKPQLEASPTERCVFRLNEAWWNPLLDQYHVDGF